MKLGGLEQNWRPPAREWNRNCVGESKSRIFWKGEKVEQPSLGAEIAEGVGYEE